MKTEITEIKATQKKKVWQQILEIFSLCTASQKKKNYYFKTKYRTETKLVPIIMDYCLFQSDALKFFLGVRLHGGSLHNFNFFNVNPKFFNEIIKFTSQISWKQIFTAFPTLVSELLDVGIIANARILQEFFSPKYQWCE